MRRHKNDTATYREPTGKERVLSFNATMRNVVDYVRVQLDVDGTSQRTRDAIIERCVRQLRGVIGEIEAMRS